MAEQSGLTVDYREGQFEVCGYLWGWLNLWKVLPAICNHCFIRNYNRSLSVNVEMKKGLKEIPKKKDKTQPHAGWMPRTKYIIG